MTTNYDSGFHFTDAIPSGDFDTLVAVLSVGLATADQLFSELSSKLRFPGYFGSNWSAVSDCLRDFHWISEKTIVICHRDIPNLEHGTLLTYIAVLQECIWSWQPGEDHKLIVTFPILLKPQLDKLLVR